MWTQAALQVNSNSSENSSSATFSSDSIAASALARGMFIADLPSMSSSQTADLVPSHAPPAPPQQQQQQQLQSQYVDGMAFHWYQGSSDRELDGSYGYNAIRAAHGIAPDMIMLASEGCSCPGVEVMILL